MDNREAARVLFAVAALLEALRANPYRIAAYRRAALGLLRLSVPATEYVTTADELDLPGLGPRLRRKLGELVTQGRLRFQDDLLAEFPQPWRDLLLVPGIGPKTADRLINELGIRGVRDLAEAARQGRLRALNGIGPIREQQLGLAAASLLDQVA